MTDHSTRRALGPWRRWTFHAWIIGSIAVAIYLVVAAPFSQALGNEFWIAGIVLPVAMFAMLASGIGWLLWLATSKPRRSER